jgi:hypothetical protein
LYDDFVIYRDFSECRIRAAITRVTAVGAAGRTGQESAGKRPIALAARWRTRRWLCLLAVWIASAAYVGARLDRGWFPLDEGTLGHSAERVLHGELPHRDFDDVYTGGLARFDAVVFEVSGTSLLSLRVAMYVVFLLWVPVVYYVATRFANPVAAGVVTLLCVVWSIPTYPAAMPSWYNLFLATFGAAALIRYTETSRRRWLFAAGVAGGLSIVIKIVGLYYVAAALLFLAFVEHQAAVSQSRETDGGIPGRSYAVLVLGGSLAFVAALVWLVRAVPGASKLVQFVLPGALLALTLSLNEWREPGREGVAVRLRRLAAMGAPFVAGLALPILVFAVPYLMTGSAGQLMSGVFIQPAKRLQFTMVAPAPLHTVAAAVAWLLVFIPGRALDEASGWPARIIVAAYAIVLSCLAVLSVHGGRPYVAVWLVVCYVVPSVVAAGCVMLLAHRPAGADAGTRRAQLWLLLCLTALCSLVQVPYAGPLYILYFAPLAILAVLGVVAAPSGRGASLGPRAALAGGFFLVYGLTAVAPGHVSIWDGGYREADTFPTVRLHIARTGLVSSPQFAERYEQVVALIDAHSKPGAYAYAAPDCPEVYFLAQRRNPTGILFDFLDDAREHDARVIRTLDERHVTAVAINTFPMFSRPIDAQLADALRTRYPDSAVVDNFIVRWAPER